MIIGFPYRVARPQFMELWEPKAVDSISRMNWRRENGDDVATHVEGYSCRKPSVKRRTRGDTYHRYSVLLKKSCKESIGREKLQVKKFIARGMKGKHQMLMEEWAWVRQEGISKTEVKEVNTGEEGNEKCWGSGPTGSNFTWERWDKVYCLKL